MKFDKFEDIKAWQIARELYLESKNVFKNVKDNVFNYQYFRAVLSIMNNIAEGFERRADNQFHYFLIIAKGSAGEVRSMLHLAKELNYCSVPEYEELISICVSISKMLSKLASSLK